MSQDYLGSLGYLTLGSRLKRAGTLLQSATQAWLAESGCEVPGVNMLVLAVLDETGPAPLGTLVDHLGIAQPGVSRMVATLKTAGLVGSVADPNDGRVWLLELTPAGRKVVEEGKQVWWSIVRDMAAELCADLQGPFSDQLSGLEEKLATGEYERSLRAELKKRNRGHDAA